jgi:hypothetical protein
MRHVTQGAAGQLAPGAKSVATSLPAPAKARAVIMTLKDHTPAEVATMAVCTLQRRRPSERYGLPIVQKHRKSNRLRGFEARLHPARSVGSARMLVLHRADVGR